MGKNDLGVEDAYLVPMATRGVRSKRVNAKDPSSGGFLLRLDRKCC